MKKEYIYIGVALLLVGGGVFVSYKMYKKYKDENNILGTEAEAAANLAQVKVNLGDKAKEEKEGVSIVFNNAKDQAVFYNNNRVSLFNSKGNILKKGTYAAGGKTITIDGGKTYTNGSVYNNLISVLLT